MRGKVFLNERFTGFLERKKDGSYSFEYDDEYLKDPSSSSISVTLPKTQKLYTSPYLFSFFFGLLAEGVNKDIQCRLLKIDEEDHFKRLLMTADEDTIGAVTVKPE